MEKKGLYWKVRGWVIETLAFLSLPVALILQTMRATSEEGYHNSAVTLKDPGHARIRIYDRWILTASYIVGIFIFFFNSNIFSLEHWATVDPDLVQWKVFSLILFPQITGGLFPFLIWSGFFAFLRFYDSKRAGIIRTINERAKVW